MSKHAYRDYAINISRKEASHAGLLLDCYLKVPVKNNESDDGDHPTDRLELLESAVAACNKSQLLYKHAYERYKADVLKTPENSWNIFKTKNRIVINLSQPSVLETNVALHHTYGVPYIPATALKGLAAHYCHCVMGEHNNELKMTGEYYRTLFGTEESSGFIIFHDAWIMPESVVDGLAREVMTPHHADYYSGKTAPTDFDNPNPITYLSIAGSFLIRVSCNSSGGDSEKWTEFAMKLLSEALENWGVGGKTYAGYGLMYSMIQPSEWLNNTINELKYHKDNNGAAENDLWKKQLAERWEKKSPEEIRNRVLDLIKKEWKSRNIEWSANQTGSALKAYRIFNKKLP